jgi:hypothetical protein
VTDELRSCGHHPTRDAWLRAGRDPLRRDEDEPERGRFDEAQRERVADAARLVREMDHARDRDAQCIAGVLGRRDDARSGAAMRGPGLCMMIAVVGV